MSNGQRSLVLDAKPGAVYPTLTAPRGLRAWWTQHCDVATKVGGDIHFGFACRHKHMRIERLEPDREVRWLHGLARRDGLRHAPRLGGGSCT